MADWAQIMAPGGRHSALVTVGSSPARVARYACGLAFLATPYAAEAHIRKVWQQGRSTRLSLLAAREALRLFDRGVVSICPTVQIAEMCHAAPTVPGAEIDPLDAEGWAAWTQTMLNVSGLLVVPEIPGWSRCPVILAQVGWAINRTVPVHIYAERVE